MSAICHLGFLKLIFKQPLWSRGPVCISIQNFIQISQTVAEILQLVLFFNMAFVRNFLISGANFGTTHNVYLVVFTLCKI